LSGKNTIGSGVKASGTGTQAREITH